MMIVTVYSYWNKKDSSLPETDLDNFMHQADDVFDVEDDVADSVLSHFKANGFVEAEGWEVDSVLYNAEKDMLVDVDFSELDEPPTVNLDQLLDTVLRNQNRSTEVS